MRKVLWKCIFWGSDGFRRWHLVNKTGRQWKWITKWIKKEGKEKEENLYLIMKCFKSRNKCRALVWPNSQSGSRTRLNSISARLKWSSRKKTMKEIRWSRIEQVRRCENERGGGGGVVLKEKAWKTHDAGDLKWKNQKKKWSKKAERKIGEKGEDG